MRYFSTSLLFSALVASVEGSHVTRMADGGLEIDLDLADLKELPQKLAEAANPHYEKRRLEPEARIFGFPNDGSDASLLNHLLEMFLPHVNTLFQRLIPDPLAAPVHGRIQVPEINLFGFCTANAAFDVNFGTLRGLSGVSIERLQVITGSESITPGWSVENGCFETFWSAAFDVAISGFNALTVDDMQAGIFGNACNYEFNEQISGGMETLAPRIRGAVNISGVLLGNLAKISAVDVVHSVDIGYDSIQAFVNEAPPALNQAIRNITGQLSNLARDELMTFLMKDQLANNVAPTVNERMYQGMRDQEISLSYTDALKLSSGFVSNGARRQIEAFAEGAADLLDRFGIDLGEDSDDEEGDEGIAGDTDPSISDRVVGGALDFLEDAAKFLSGAGLDLGEEQETEDAGIVEGAGDGGEDFGIIPQEVVEAAAELFRDTQQQIIQGAANILGGGQANNEGGDEGIDGGTEEGVDVITENTLQQAAKDAVEGAVDKVSGVLEGFGIGVEETSGENEDGDSNEGGGDGEGFGVVPEIFASAQYLFNSIFNGGGNR